MNLPASFLHHFWAMGVLHHCRRHHHSPRPFTLFLFAAFAFLFFFLASASSAIANHHHPTSLGVKERTATGAERVAIRRSLGGPGSSPPTCRSKCGRCSPCQAVHVPIQPGLSIPLEYYPEAWRCKCGNTLFMP